jgi:putative acetyltransferase
VTGELVIDVDDPAAEDVRALLRTHREFSEAVTPAGHVHALVADDVLDPAITLLSARRDGALVAVGALRQLDSSHGEIKAMHTAVAARGTGAGRAVLEHLLALARARGYERVSLETGTMDAFAPARTLYRSAGFDPCAPFGEYTENPHSVCMSLRLD